MIALGCDHGGLNIKNAVIKYLEDKGIEYKDFGCFTEESVDYPEYAFMVAQSVTSGETELGILCCGTGIGISMRLCPAGLHFPCSSQTYSGVKSRHNQHTSMPLPSHSSITSSDSLLH